MVIYEMGVDISTDSSREHRNETAIVRSRYMISSVIRRLNNKLQIYAYFPVMKNFSKN